MATETKSTKPFGRPSKYSDELALRIVKRMRTSHCSYSSACESVGVSRATGSRWRHHGEGPHGRQPFRDFASAVTAAEECAKFNSMNLIAQAGAGMFEWTETRRTQEYEINKGGAKVLVRENVVTTVKRVPPQWQANAWLLERRYPSEYGRREEADGEKVRGNIVAVPVESDSMDAWEGEARAPIVH